MIVLVKCAELGIAFVISSTFTMWPRTTSWSLSSAVLTSAWVLMS